METDRAVVKQNGVNGATPWLTVRQAAARAQCGVRVIYVAVAGRKLKAVKVGTALRIHVEWLDAWLDAAGMAVTQLPEGRRSRGRGNGEQR
jgi:excisionase family DNA binding protein